MEIFLVACMICIDHRNPVLFSQIQRARSDEHRMMHMDAVISFFAEFPQDLQRDHSRVYHPVIHPFLLYMIPDDPLRRAGVLLRCISVLRCKHGHFVPQPDQFMGLSFHGDRHTAHERSVIICQHCYLHV